MRRTSIETALLLALVTTACLVVEPAPPDATVADAGRDDGGLRGDAEWTPDSWAGQDGDPGTDARAAADDASPVDSASSTLLDSSHPVDARPGADVSVAVDADLLPDVSQPVDAGDPCQGLTPCSEVARRCEGDTLVICAPHAAGASSTCLAETRVDCTGRGQSCTDDGEPTCTGSGLCPAARVLDCDSGTLVDTTLVGLASIDDYSCDPDASPYSSFEGREALYALTVDRDTRVTVTATPLDGLLRAYQLFVLRAAGQACSGELDCVAPPQDGYATNQQQSFDALAGETFYLSYDLKGNFLLDHSTRLQLSVLCQDPVCGNGLQEIGEGCDDAATAPEDGCSATCQVEEGWACDTAAGQVSVCHAMGCGDGVVDANEACDDGNTRAEDGCSPGCALEAGFQCFGEPSRCYAGGDSCDQPIALQPGLHRLDSSGYTDSGVDLACDYAGNSGKDLYLSVEIPAQTLLSARLTADWYEAELFALSGCDDLAHSCQRSGDLDLFNGSTQAVQRLLLVDTSSYASSPSSGAFDLDLALTPAAQLPAGDSCHSAQRIETASLPITVQGDTTGLHNLYARYFNAGTACTYYTSYAGTGGGADKVYVVQVPAGKTLRAHVTTSWSGSGDTDSVLVISPSCDVENACLAYGNQEGAALSVVNSTQAAADYFVVVDGFGATHAGSFGLSLELVD